MKCTDCIDWKDTNVSKLTRFKDDLDELAPNFLVWACRSASRLYDTDSSIDVETYILFFIANQTNSIPPDRYMKFKTINSNQKRLDSAYYDYLLYNISKDVKILEEVGIL